jgi:hypothetical protein
MPPRQRRGVSGWTSEDAGLGPNGRSDGGEMCPAPLGDAGFASLTSVPVAALCAQSSLYRGGSAGIVEQAQCGAWTVVVEATGPPCLSFWLFNDAGTLLAFGEGCEAYSCTQGVPGFLYPLECVPGGNELQYGPSLCPGADAGQSTDSAVDAVADSTAASD